MPRTVIGKSSLDITFVRIPLPLAFTPGQVLSNGTPIAVGTLVFMDSNITVGNHRFALLSVST